MQAVKTASTSCKCIIGNTIESDNWWGKIMYEAGIWKYGETGPRFTYKDDRTEVELFKRWGYVPEKKRNI